MKKLQQGFIWPLGTVASVIDCSSLVVKVQVRLPHLDTRVLSVRSFGSQHGWTNSENNSCEIDSVSLRRLTSHYEDSMNMLWWQSIACFSVVFVTLFLSKLRKWNSCSSFASNLHLNLIAFFQLSSAVVWNCIFPHAVEMVFTCQWS